MVGTLFRVGLVGFLAAGMTACTPHGKIDPFWKGERVCLPCHQYKLPIARNHNYRCDTCHNGQPYARDKETAHIELFPHPQDEQVIAYTCSKCHNEKLGYDIPYDAEFVRDVLISHGDYVE